MTTKAEEELLYTRKRIHDLINEQTEMKLEISRLQEAKDRQIELTKNTLAGVAEIQKSLSSLDKMTSANADSLQTISRITWIIVGTVLTGIATWVATH